MARLYRPHIPLRIRVQVAERQLKQAGIAPISTEKLSTFLFLALDALARHIGCERQELRLDHDPALGARPKTGEGKRTRYTPDANDPDALRYRPHGPEFEASHLIKTNIRGDHGQHPDRVLIKKERRRQKAEAEGLDKNVKKKRRDLRSGSAHSHAHKPKTKWAKRAFPKGRGFSSGRKI